MSEEAYRIIRETLAEINDQWKPDTQHDGDRFQKFDDLLIESIRNGDLERIKEICDRYKAAVLRDIQNRKQGKLF